MKNNERVGVLSGAFFLFGLAALVWLDAVWPGILVLIGLTALPILLVEEGLLMTLWIGTQMSLWLVGLPLLIRAGKVWPGVLVLAGLSAVIVALVNPDDLQKRHKARLAGRTADPYFGKAKRGIPVPGQYADDDDLLDDECDDWNDEDEDAPPSARRSGHR